MSLKKTTFLILKILIALFAYLYIAWKLVDYKSSTGSFNWGEHLKTKEFILLVLVFLLMFLNWSIEALKWQKLVKGFTKIDFVHSFKAVLAGISTGIFTPNRIGEFAGRPYFTNKEKITSGVFAGFAGSLSQSLVTIFLGILALNFYLISSQNHFFTDLKYLLAVLIFSLIIAGLFAYLFFHLEVFTTLIKYLSFLKKYEDNLLFLNNYSKKELFIILSLSFFRYLIFFNQFYILLHIFGVNICLYEAFIAISLVYLFLFSIPTIAFSELGIRGSLSVFFIGIYSADYPEIIMASIVLWILNLAVPATAGTIIILFKRYK
ncbi:MAG: flippase-like domain-containing protein [Bacteroidales bacterium]|nr:flippase-like domain-containing protein [Bacteroidales bacterium]